MLPQVLRTFENAVFRLHYGVLNYRALKSCIQAYEKMRENDKKRRLFPYTDQGNRNKR